jgi:hypothetical protein
MAKSLTEAHHQWIREVSGGAVDPAAYPESAAGFGTPTTDDESDDDAADHTELRAHKKLFEQIARDWMAVEETILTGIDALRQEVVRDFDGDPDAQQAEADFLAHAHSMFDTFDGSLVDELYSIKNCKSAAEVAELKMRIIEMITQYKKFVSSDPVIAHLDQNPFIKLSIAKDCASALADIDRKLG